MATVVGVVSVGTLAGYSVTALAIFPAGETSGNLVRVPDLVNEKLADARARVEKLGLVFAEKPGQHHKGPPGTILAQEPLPGQMALPGSEVRVTLSLGPQFRPVPDVIGLSQDHAQVALERAGLRSEIVRVDARADVGEVVATEPPPGTALERPSEVRLLVSDGPRTINVPELVTRSLSEAQATLDRIGLKLGEVRQDSSSLAAPGTVIEQSPQAGAEVARGTRILVTIAFTPGGRPVPRVEPEPEDTMFTPAGVPARNEEE